MVMLSLVVILVSTLWTGLVGDWRLALVVVKEVDAEGKGFGYFLVEVGKYKQHNPVKSASTMAQIFFSD